MKCFREDQPFFKGYMHAFNKFLKTTAVDYI